MRNVIFSLILVFNLCGTINARADKPAIHSRGAAYDNMLKSFTLRSHMKTDLDRYYESAVYAHERFILLLDIVYQYSEIKDKKSNEALHLLETYEQALKGINKLTSDIRYRTTNINSLVLIDLLAFTKTLTEFSAFIDIKNSHFAKITHHYLEVLYYNLRSKNNTPDHPNLSLEVQNAIKEATVALRPAGWTSRLLNIKSLFSKPISTSIEAPDLQQSPPLSCISLFH